MIKTVNNEMNYYVKTQSGKYETFTAHSLCETISNEIYAHRKWSVGVCELTRIILLSSFPEEYRVKIKNLIFGYYTKVLTQKKIDEINSANLANVIECYNTTPTCETTEAFLKAFIGSFHETGKLKDYDEINFAQLNGKRLNYPEIVNELKKEIRIFKK